MYQFLHHSFSLAASGFNLTSCIYICNKQPVALAFRQFRFYCLLFRKHCGFFFFLAVFFSFFCGFFFSSFNEVEWTHGMSLSKTNWWTLKRSLGNNRDGFCDAMDAALPLPVASHPEGERASSGETRDSVSSTKISSIFPSNSIFLFLHTLTLQFSSSPAVNTNYFSLACFYFFITHMLFLYAQKTWEYTRIPSRSASSNRLRLAIKEGTPNLSPLFRQEKARCCAFAYIHVLLFFPPPFSLLFPSTLKYLPYHPLINFPRTSPAQFAQGHRHYSIIFFFLFYSL